MEAKVSAFHRYVPERIVDNHFFESIVETNDEWIRTRTGIKERRFVAQGEMTGDLCFNAAISLSEHYDIPLDDVDFILVATITPDQAMPSTAAQLQNRLGIKSAGALDITAACAGFGYGLVVAQGLVATGIYKKILVFGSETLSHVTDLADRTTCILFGDGAGVALVEASEHGNILGSIAGTDGSGGADLYLSQNNQELNGVEIDANNKIHQNGKKVFKWAVKTITSKIKELVASSDLSLDDIDWIVPHSANLRIIEAICRGIEFPVEKTLQSVVDFGNTSSASIPIALANGVLEGKLKKGDKILIIGFGGGLTYAGMILEWQD